MIKWHCQHLSKLVWGGDLLRNPTLVFVTSLAHLKAIPGSEIRRFGGNGESKLLIFQEIANQLALIISKC